MKKRFFKKLKKYILVLSCILSCLVILSVSVSAESNLQYLIDNGKINLTVNSFGIPGPPGIPQLGASLLPETSLSDLIGQNEIITDTYVNFYQNANIISERLIFSSNSKSILLEEGSSFNGTIYGIGINWIIEATSELLGFIWLNDKIDYTFYLQFFNSRKPDEYSAVIIDDYVLSFSDGAYLSFNCDYVPIDCDSFMIDIRYSVDDSNLIDERNKMPLSYFINNGRVVTHQVQFISLELIFNSKVPPLSERPNYSKPSSGSTSELEGLESEIIGSTNSQAAEKTDFLFGTFFDAFDNFSVSISAFRDAFNYFVDSNGTITFIVTVTLITGIILLFSNFPINRGGSK